tara:strand:+ start:219 stop:422 length:204 start_codon:yes stop_codon:yes gene_type:complete
MVGDLDAFNLHQEECEDCRFFPLRAACYVGAKLLNPDLEKTFTEEQYWENINKSHEDCDWCNDVETC